ncbi:MAG: CBS domain-containing protein [Anaeromyxobacter sp.]
MSSRLGLQARRTGQPEAAVAIKVGDIMDRAPVSVAPDLPVIKALALVRAAGVEHLLVVDEDGLVGVLCSCDLAPGDDLAEPVSDRMSVPVLTVGPWAEVAEAALTLGDCGVGCLPVVEEGRVLGVITAEVLDRLGLAAEGWRHGAGHRHHPH